MIEKYHPSFSIEAGCDEAGRGCLSGPVVAAAVILKAGFEHELIVDSKRLTPEKRSDACRLIKKNALTFGVAFVSPQEIDRINILNASILAMHKALDKLSPVPEFVIVDGNRFKPYKNIPYRCIVKGDTRYLSIAAASILAKTYRDDYMKRIHKEFPVYNWAQNKGYPTQQHKKAIAEQGVSEHHRKSFHLLSHQLSFDF